MTERTKPAHEKLVAEIATLKNDIQALRDELLSTQKSWAECFQREKALERAVVELALRLKS